jgi:hypothetical protein
LIPAQAAVAHPFYSFIILTGIHDLTLFGTIDEKGCKIPIAIGTRARKLKLLPLEKL